MKEITGKYNECKVFTDNIDKETEEQLKTLMNQEFIKDNKVRIMPDCHAGSGCVIGTTMTLTDKVVPNLVGVDIGCVDRDTEVLTKNGWINISDYNKQEILVYDRFKDSVCFEYPYAYIKKECNKFYHFKNDGVNQVVSDEHKMLYFKRDTNGGLVSDITSGKAFYKMLSKATEPYFTKSSFVLNNKVYKGLNVNEYVVRLLLWIALMGNYRYSNGFSYVTQKIANDGVKERIITYLDLLHVDYNLDNNKLTYVIEYNVGKLLENKYESKQMELAWFFDEYLYYMDCITLGYNVRFNSKNDIVDFIQYASCCLSQPSKIVNLRDIQQISFINEYNFYDRNLIAIRESQDGYKYCFTTSTGYFVIRREGIISVTGNCGMLATKLEETFIDLEKLDEVVHTYVPSGFHIHDKAIAKSNASEVIAKIDLEKSQQSLGTLGGGNHFIELDKDSNGNLWLVIHTGSRHLGLEVCNYYQNLAIENLKAKSNGGNLKDLIANKIKELKTEGRQKDIEKELMLLKQNYSNTVLTIPNDLAYIEGVDFENYIHDMRLTQEHAKINRQTIVNQIISNMGLHISESFDTIHNYIDCENMILRKGSISAEKGEKVIIPMNMRDGSLICIGKGNSDWNKSAPHGAGRLMSRSQARHNLNLEDFKDSMKDIYSTCVVESTIDESPMVYKNMYEIMDNIVDTVDVVDIIKPLYNFKATDV